MSAAPNGVPSGYTGTGYAPLNRVLPSYTPNVQGSAFTGGLLDLLQAARLADVNALRVAVENQRALAEGSAQLVNALRADLIALGVITT